MSVAIRKRRTTAPGGGGDAGRDLSEAFVRDVLADWQLHGAATISSVRVERPLDYLKLVTTLFPKDAETKVDALDQLSDEQLAGQLAAVLARLATAGGDPGGGAGPAGAA